MNWAKQRHVPDIDYETVQTPPPRRSGAAAVATALVTSALAAGFGYYALKLSGEQQATRGKLERREEELATLQDSNAGAVRKLAALTKERGDRDGLLAQANAKLLELNTELAATHTRLDGLKEERSEIADQLAEFRQMTQQFRRMIDSGRLQVTFRKGRMIVELPDQVLFPSGSADLTDDGKKALAEVARILRGMRSRRFVVAGHTDNIPVATEQFKSNWELSSARAVGVTAALIRGGLRPEQLVAAGYSEYDPVANNAKPAGRQKNRRIEIILEPRLKELPALEKKDKPAKAAASPRKAKPERTLARK